MAEEEEAVPVQIQYEGEEEIHEYLTKDGKAKVTYPNGDSYEGNYLNGLRHGLGTYVFATQKGKYVGNWEAGLKTGTGEFHYPDGSRFKGQWTSDKRNGKGTYYYANGDVYCGDWNMGVKEGHGSYVNGADGSRLVGSWANGSIAEGKWEMKGVTYTGKFENGQPVGEGSMKYVVEETLAHVEEGEYVDSKWQLKANSKLPLPKKYKADRRAYNLYEAKADFPDLNNNNWMSKCLTSDIYEKYRNAATKNGYTIDLAIQTGVDNNTPNVTTVGLTAGDEETYETFKDLFDPVITGRHFGYPSDYKHPTNLDASMFEHEGFDEKYVVSSRVRTGRSVRGFCLPSFTSRGERRKVADILKQATEGLGAYRDDLIGKYEDMSTMSDDRLNELISKNLMFDRPVSPILLSGGLARDWPDARGVFLGEKENFVIWVNEEDHCRIISMQSGGNMKEVFERYCSACNGLEEELVKLGHEYMKNEHLGFIVTNPANLGTAMRAGVQVKIPLLSKHEKFEEILTNLRLQKCVVDGAEADSGIYDISNIDRLGFSEIQIMKMVCDGISSIIELEKALEKEEDISEKISEPIETPW